MPKERLLCSGNENPKTKLKSSFRIRKSIIKKTRFEKKSKTHILEKGVWKVFLYAPHFLRTFSSFSAEIGCWCRKQLPLNGFRRILGLAR